MRVSIVQLERFDERFSSIFVFKTEFNMFWCKNLLGQRFFKQGEEP